MDAQERIAQINAQIAALEKEKESLLYTGSIFGGPEFEKLFMKNDQYAFFTDIFTKLIRKTYGFSALRVSKMPKERGERLQSLVEQLSEVLNRNMDIYEWPKPVIAGDPAPSLNKEPHYGSGIYTKLSETGVLSYRSYGNLYRHAGIETVFDLLRADEETIRRTKGIGQETLLEINKFKALCIEMFCTKED